MTLPAEFAFIARHFRGLAGSGALDLLDDAALLTPTPGRELVIAADAMVEGVHFRADDPPFDLGRKLLRANLSDLAAMGARPRAYLLTIAVPPGRDDAFFGAFAAGLAADQLEFGVSLLGGDTVSIAGPLTMSLTIIGEVTPGDAIRRSGARPGDALFVTGTIGDGALGLRALDGTLADPQGILAERYHLPRPRLGVARAGLATACIDVSDGLIQDAGHLARASGVVIEITCDLIPRSDAAIACGTEWLETCLTGGDDYELLITAPVTALEQLRASGVAVTRIGRVVSGPPGVVLAGPDGVGIDLPRHGYSHL